MRGETDRYIPGTVPVATSTVGTSTGTTVPNVVLIPFEPRFDWYENVVCTYNFVFNAVPVFDW